MLNIELDKEEDLQFGIKLKALREHRKLSQKQLAGLIDSSNVQISNYENGHVKNLGIKTVKKILRSLEINSTYFFEEAHPNLEEFLKTQECNDLIDALMNMNEEDRKAFVRFAVSHAYSHHIDNFRKNRRS